MSVSGRRLSFVIPVIVMFLGTALAALPSFGVDAVETITNRSLTLSSSSPADSNATTTYTFTFTVANTTTPIKSVGIQICSTADGTCTAPGAGTGGGFSNASATLASQPTGLGASSGWTINGSPATTNELDITNSSNSTAPTGSQTIVFGNVQNPTAANETFFARITTYSDAAYTTAVDNGVTAASTANQIVLSGTMPEALTFCTGQTIGLDGNNNPDCTTATNATINFNQDFSPTTPSFATSQFAASTNAKFGYAITVTGPTLTSGSNSITAMTTTDVSKPGTPQFGMNLAADTAANTAAVPVAPASAGITPTGGSYDKAEALTGFATGGAAGAAQYTFDASTTNSIADSQNSAADPQLYTATYMVNVPGHQAAGVYQTTLTYICTPTY